MLEEQADQLPDRGVKIGLGERLRNRTTPVPMDTNFTGAVRGVGEGSGRKNRGSFVI